MALGLAARLMPARSEAQRRALNARHGHAWVKRHGFDNKGKLPKRRDRRQRLVDQFIRHGQT